MGTSLPPSCRAAPAQLCLTGGSQAGRTTQEGGVSLPCHALGLCPVLPGLSIHPATASRSHVHHWEEGRVVIMSAISPPCPVPAGAVFLWREVSGAPGSCRPHVPFTPVLPVQSFCWGISQHPWGQGQWGHGTELWESPSAVSTQATKEKPKDEDFGVAACLGLPRVMAWGLHAPTATASPCLSHTSPTAGKHGSTHCSTTHTEIITSFPLS